VGLKSDLNNLTAWLPSVLWHCWLDHVPIKTVPKMTCK